MAVEPPKTTDLKHRSRRGPSSIPDAARRRHTVSSRFTPDELAALDERRATVRMRRGEYLRRAALQDGPATIPAINRDAWTALARTASNLNQIAREANRGGIPPALAVSLAGELGDCRRLLAEVRHALIGLHPDDGS